MTPIRSLRPVARSADRKAVCTSEFKHPRFSKLSSLSRQSEKDDSFLGRRTISGGWASMKTFEHAGESLQAGIERSEVFKPVQELPKEKMVQAPQNRHATQHYEPPSSDLGLQMPMAMARKNLKSYDKPTQSLDRSQHPIHVSKKQRHYVYQSYQDNPLQDPCLRS